MMKTFSRVRVMFTNVIIYKQYVQLIYTLINNRDFTAKRWINSLNRLRDFLQKIRQRLCKNAETLNIIHFWVNT